MFETKSEIRPFLADFDLEQFAPEIEALCVPALAFETGGAPVGQLGGTPAMPAALAWPEHPAYREGKALMARFGDRSPGLGRKFDQATPLHFVASIDLAAVRRTGVSGALPGEGRLLFFWDPMCGPWIETEESCRVIYDNTPAAALARRDAPDALKPFAQDDYMPAVFAEQTLSPHVVLSVPDRFLMPDIGSDKLREAMEDPDLEGEWDSFFDAQIDAGARQLASGREVLPHRLGGWPIPEQGDPRWAAVASARGVFDALGRMPDEQQRALCDAEMHLWTLLLQIDLNNLDRAFAEGTIYYVMRSADLKAGNFDRVHAIYQQT